MGPKVIQEVASFIRMLVYHKAGENVKAWGGCAAWPP